MKGRNDRKAPELAFAASAPSVARSALHGRPLRCMKPKTTTAIRPTSTRLVQSKPKMAFDSFFEAVSRRGLLNNAITCGFIGAALWVMFTPVKTSAVGGKTGGKTAAAGAAETKLIDPAEGKVTSKVFFDLAIDGVPAGRIVVGT